LTVEKAGNGDGKINSTPPGIDCSADCNEVYLDGTKVTLVATPDSDSTFMGWENGCSGDNLSTTVTIDAAKTCTAKFAAKIPLTVDKTGNGDGKINSIPPGIDCGTDCNEVYTDGTKVTLVATPDSNSTFTGWENGCSGTNLSTTVTIDVAKTCTAKFTSKFPLTVNKTGNGNGQVQSTPAGINCGIDCAEIYADTTEKKLTVKSDNGQMSGTTNRLNCGMDCTNSYTDGTKVTLTATPDSNSTFAGWKGACGGNDVSTTVTMDAAKTCTVVFDKIESCKELPKIDVGMTFSAKFPDKAGKYYIVPAEVVECLKLIQSSTVLIIEKPPECEPAGESPKPNVESSGQK